MDNQVDGVLDVSRLESLVEEIGDRDLVAQAVQAFLDEQPERLANIRVAMAGGEPDQVRDMAHALGSPAAMLGAVAIRSATKAMQAAATEGRLDKLPALYEAVLDAAHRTEAAMKDYLGSASAG